MTEQELAEALKEYVNSKPSKREIERKLASANVKVTQNEYGFVNVEIVEEDEEEQDA